MPPVVYLHIGAFKTGTSFLQSRLWALRNELAEQGVLFPGEHGWGDQVRAISHVAGRKDPHGGSVPAEPWDELLAQIRAWPGHAAILSFEFLSLARPRQVRRIVDALAPAEVRVVVTARDLVRVVPAMWQEVVQGGQTWSWPQYCETVTSPVGRTVPPGRAFWRAQDLPAVVRRWATAVPVERIQIVTVPPPGTSPDELWHRFCTATAISGLPAPVEPDTALPNESLDPPGAELMRRVNLAVEGRLSRAVYDRVLKAYVAKKVLAGRAGPERLALSPEHVRWARDRGAAMATDLRELGVAVVGDLGDLVGSPVTPGRSTAAPEVRTEDVLDAAVAVIAALAPRVAEARRATAATPPEPAGSARPDAGRGATVGSHALSRLVRRAYERLRG